MSREAPDITSLRQDQNRINKALRSGDLEIALALCEAALKADPHNDRLLQKKGRILKRAARRAQASLARALPVQAPSKSRIKAASGAFAAGELARADEIYQSIPIDDAAYGAAQVGLAEIAEIRGDLVAATRILAALIPDADACDMPPAEPAVLIKYWGLLLRTGEVERVQGMMACADPSMGKWPLLKFLQIAEKAGATEAALRALRLLLASERISRNAAMHLVMMAQTIGDGDLAARLRIWLGDQLSQKDRTVFLLDSLKAVFGPEAALAEARHMRVAGHEPQDAAAIAGLLLETGRRAVAGRYLRLCRRKWPESRTFLRLLIGYHLCCGQPRAALDLVEGTAGREVSPLENLRLRFRILCESGDLENARNLLAQAGDRAPLITSFQRRMNMDLALGQTDSAEALSAEIAAKARRGRLDLAHFALTHMGAMLNDTLLFEQAGGHGAARDLPQEALEEYSPHFFAPAKQLLDRWLALPKTATAPVLDSDIPRLIHQYWDKRPIMPQIEHVMGSWRGRAGYDYRAHSRSSAEKYLAAAFDETHLRAFRMANNIAEECDFFRLCLLFAEGGIYADADDMLVGDPDRLRELGAGAILFREPYGAIANNLMISSPGHELFGIAVEMARAALLGRESDSTWLKTGPGLISRAAACYLATCRRRGQVPNLTIHPLHLGQRQVQSHMRLPYKTAPGYWNAAKGKLPDALKHALKEALAGQAMP
ncbi:glycosyltransferase family 32 protein [Paracoccus ravus]|uniref:glycosyltransferase family 32 protein n=1 Tax=Paracoccus ravus TaxID=2447760 RepID=UPI00106EE811|nr:glycosyltransferase [Paracoccus ravus]